MKQAEESAAKTEAKCNGCFRFKGKGSIIHAKLFQRILESRIIRAVSGIDAAVYHGSNLAVTRKRFRGRI